MPKEADLQPGERPLVAFISSVMRPELEWARAETVAPLSENPTLVPWAFEFTPPSSDNAAETYLQKVREANFVIWLVGDETTPAVADEIAEAIAADRRLWVIRLPADARDDRTNALMELVRSRAKYGDAKDPKELRVTLSLTFNDEVIRALRDAPGMTRIARLEALARTSRGRMVTRWRGAGLSRAESIELADDLSIGSPEPGLLPNRETPFKVIVGEVGAGKSVLAERALQHAIIEARRSATSPVPVFLHARDTTNGLEASVKSSASGLGDPAAQGAFVVIDGADEVPQAHAARLVEEARVMVEALPGTRVLMTSRPSPAVNIEERRSLLPLDEAAAQALVHRIARESEGSLTMRWPRALDEAVRRPLFAILYGLHVRDRGTGSPTVGALIAKLVEKALDPDRVGQALPWLERLAALSIDRDGAPVDGAELGPYEGRRAVGDSRLVVQEAGSVGFALPIFAQWFAAQSLLRGVPALAELLEPRRLERWRYPLAIAVATGPAEVIDRLMDGLAREAPGFAAQVIEEALHRWASGVQQSDPDWRSAGAQLRNAFLAFADGIAPLDEPLLPRMPDGQLQPLAVRAWEGDLLTGWYEGVSAEEVVEIPEGISVLGESQPEWNIRELNKWNADPDGPGARRSKGCGRT